jgi:hypothetical protein
MKLNDLYSMDETQRENVLDGLTISELALLEIQASSLIALLQCIYFDVQKARYKKNTN